MYNSPLDVLKTRCPGHHKCNLVFSKNVWFELIDNYVGNYKFNVITFNNKDDIETIKSDKQNDVTDKSKTNLKLSNDKSNSQLNTLSNLNN